VRREALILLLSLVVARAAPGQEPSATLRGSVVTATGEPVPYALVRLVPSNGRRFTDQRGIFVLSGVAPGVQRLQVRQLGFEPFDSAVTILATGTTIRVALRPLAIELSAITVSASARCTNPGPPDSTKSRALAALFAQMLENAARYVVLAESYPYTYRMERTSVAYDKAMLVLWSERDTLEYGTDGTVRYRPGDVVRWGPGPSGRRERVLNLPTLPDFADSAFQGNHCYAYGGMVEAEGQRLVRFEFRAAESLRTSDIEGEVDLDQRTYQIRRATVRLTHPGRAVPGLASASSTVWFGEIRPSIVVPIRVESVVVPTLERQTQGRSAHRGDDQRLIDVRFIRALPDSGGPTP
jgi:hypothetical protein